MPDSHAAIPQWTPTQREIDDLDLMLNDCLRDNPLGFVNPADAGDASPFTLVVGSETAEVAVGVGALELIDPEGAPLARVTIEKTWGAGEERVGLVGPVERLSHDESGPFRRLHLPPARIHRSQPVGPVLAVPVHRPLTSADLAAIRNRADELGALVLLLACVGEGMPSGVSGPALVRVTLQGASLLGDARVVAVSAADHGWDQQHGKWRSPNDWLLSSVASAYGSHVLILDREDNGNLPAAIASLVERDRPPRDRQGVVIFFTGLSGSGKSTLARALIAHILEQGDRTVTSLDGDVVRHHLSKGLGFSREDRETNIVRIGFVAAEVSRHGGVAVCSPIAPFESTRAEVRRLVERAGGGFVLVHVATPLAECERRDRKGLYARARAGDIPDFTGISSPYEPPTNAIKIDTTNRLIVECLAELVEALAAEGWIPD
ncbi:MAG: adenylyl-sulfate kinase [Actinomycetota bacterium]|nr:adenylyl-sulfate kinase [Actinomycetota bacterium]